MKKIILLIMVSIIFCCKNIGQNSSEKGIQKKSISMKLKENNHLSIKKQIELYKKLKKEKLNEYNFENEDELTMYAYSYLWGNQPKNALAIFLLIAEQFPNSANAYDSLGEVYLALGNKELSLFNYTKALRMNPDNFNAEDQIELIRNPNKKTLTPSEKFNKIYTVEGYKNDLDELGKKLIEVNPSTLKFISKKNFWQLIENKKALISKNTTFGDFIWHCNEIIASINCSHTSLDSFRQESSMLNTAQIFPLQTRWVNNKLYVIDALTNSDKVKIKDEITHINNISVSTIIDNIYKHIQSQGYTKSPKRAFFNKWSTEMIPYELGFPTSYKIKIKGNRFPIALNKAKKTIAPYEDTSIQKHKNNLHLDFIDSTKTAVLTISSFNYYVWNNLNEFQNFINNSFKKINDKKTKNLVLDLRFNGGGSAESSIYLLKHLVDKPFTYFSKSTHNNIKGFNGKMYFIIDGNGESTTGHFMSKVKELNLGKIIGEELGSNHFCTAGQTVLRLKNTKLVYYVANTASSLHSKFPFDYLGVQPDIFITQPIDDYLNNYDTVRIQTLNLIKNEK
ncbi:MAG: peptidase S41 [Flavobacteriaceae bacterium]|nr:peptidase S41 [Flavobacteriaceae bacterium]